MASGAKPKRQTPKLRTVGMSVRESFPLSPWHKFNHHCDYRPPKEIGHYSLDKDRLISHDKSRLRYLLESRTEESHRVRVDLMQGFEKMTFTSFYFNERLDHILQWILKNRDLFAYHQKRSSPKRLATTKSTATDERIGKEEHTDKLSTLNTDFVVRRGCLTRLLCTLYWKGSSWQLAVIRFKDTFYLCEMKTDSENMEREKMTIHRALKFEQYITTDQSNREPDMSLPLNNCEVYCTVMETHLNNHSLILNGVVDCVDSDGEYVMLRTKDEFKTTTMDDYFKRFRLFKYWALGFLHGAPKIICGFHRNEVLHRLQEFNTVQIPYMVKDIKNPWDPNVCVDFLDQFLTFIKETIQENDPRKVYLFNREAHGRSITWRLLKPDTEFQFLPQWYIDAFEN